MKSSLPETQETPGVPKEIDPKVAVVEYCKDLSHYANLEVKDHERHFDDLAEDLLIRIDEFEHLLELSKSDTTACLFKQVPKMADKFREMEKVFEKIDRLELMVTRVKANMDMVEKRLAEAEGTVEGGALSSLMPLFFGSRPLTTQQHSGSQGSSLSSDQQPGAMMVFSTSEFFPPETAK